MITSPLHVNVVLIFVLELPSLLKFVLEDPEVIKVGVGIRGEGCLCVSATA